MFVGFGGVAFCCCFFFLGGGGAFVVVVVNLRHFALLSSTLASSETKSKQIP